MLNFKNMVFDKLLLLLFQAHGLTSSRKYHKPMRLGMHHVNKPHPDKIKRCFLNGGLH